MEIPFPNPRTQVGRHAKPESWVLSPNNRLKKSLYYLKYHLPSDPIHRSHLEKQGNYYLRCPSTAMPKGLLKSSSCTNHLDSVAFPSQSRFPPGSLFRSPAFPYQLPVGIAKILVIDLASVKPLPCLWRRNSQLVGIVKQRAAGP